MFNILGYQENENQKKSMRYHLTCARIVKIKTSMITYAGEDVE